MCYSEFHWGHQFFNKKLLSLKTGKAAHRNELFEKQFFSFIKEDASST